MSTPAKPERLSAPCAWCGYNGQNYWQAGTHDPSCFWFEVGGREARLRVLDTISPHAPIGPGESKSETCALCGNTREWHRNPGRSGVHKYAERLGDLNALRPEPTCLKCGKTRADHPKVTRVVDEHPFTYERAPFSLESEDLASCDGCKDCKEHRAKVEAQVRERDQRIAYLEQRIELDNAVCLCPCPSDEHENLGEDGEQCQHEEHVCLRVAPAVRTAFANQEARIAELEQEACSAKEGQADAE